MFIQGLKGCKAISRSLLARPGSEKNKYCQIFKPVPLPRRLFWAQTSMDRNEKVVMYGVKHVLAIDCHSCFIAAFSTMRIKNHAIIYDEVYWYLFYSLRFQTLSEESRTHHTFVFRKTMTLSKLCLSLAANLKGNPETGKSCFHVSL